LYILNMNLNGFNCKLVKKTASNWYESCKRQILIFKILSCKKNKSNQGHAISHRRLNPCPSFLSWKRFGSFFTKKESFLDCQSQIRKDSTTNFFRQETSFQIEKPIFTIWIDTR
jgi:hypothetical protein